MKKILGILGLVACLTLGTVGCNSNEDKKDDGKQEKTTKSSDSVELNISAAASLKEAMAKIEEEYKKVDSNVKLTVNYGASGSLQQQIEQGAPCDLFISAGQKQMKALDEEKLLVSDTMK
ncbi:TPA: molybdate ABC transporter substrate-binding protein, partial [Clostridioides difficile]|nr:molybdate ABC transporter substrate-binding protein [Clostridioides difficile]